MPQILFSFINLKKSFFIFFLLLFVQCSFSQTLDSSFGVNGMQILPVENAFVYLTSAIFQDSNILVSTADADENHYFPTTSIFRLTNNGSFDTTFHNVNIPTLTQGILVLQKDNKILAAGNISDRSGQTPTGTMVIYRFLENGDIDPTFGNKGKFSLYMYTYNTISKIAVRDNGKIIGAGNIQTQTGNVVSFFQLKSSGKLDSSFGTNGFIYKTTPYEVECIGLKILPQGKILAGFEYGGQKKHTCLIRYKKTGKIDSSFGVNGVVLNNNTVIPYKSIHGTNMAIALEDDNKILEFVGDSTKFGNLYSYKGNGEANESFGDHGKIIVSHTRYLDFHFFMAIDSSNKILINEGDAVRSVSRYKQYGVIDSSFGINGVLSNSKVSDEILVQPGNKLVFAGTYSYPDTPALVRYKFDAPKSIVINNSGLEQIQKSIQPDKNSIIIYPNPAQNLLHISGLNEQSVYQLKIIDAKGNIVSAKQTTGNYDYDIKKLNAGVYYLTITSNNKTITAKFVKE